MSHQGKNNTISPADKISDDTLLGLQSLTQLMTRLLALQPLRTGVKVWYKFINNCFDILVNQLFQGVLK